MKCHNFYQLGPSNRPSHVVENGFFSVKCIRADESLLFEVLVPFTNGIKKHVYKRRQGRLERNKILLKVMDLRNLSIE